MSIFDLVIYNQILCKVISFKLDRNFAVISNYFPSNAPLHETVHVSLLSETHLTIADLYVANIHSDAELLEAYPELFI